VVRTTAEGQAAHVAVACAGMKHCWFIAQAAEPCVFARA